ncbi:hypothetical protein F5Y14DRAFT_454330 [Nemania sp. NC0429]|nr:hypothetical protein F5Y14DRAFT_454330 [Nemania sp. NC0429]
MEVRRQMQGAASQTPSTQLMQISNDLISSSDLAALCQYVYGHVRLSDLELTPSTSQPVLTSRPVSMPRYAPETANVHRSSCDTRGAEGPLPLRQARVQVNSPSSSVETVDLPTLEKLWYEPGVDPKKVTPTSAELEILQGRSPLTLRFTCYANFGLGVATQPPASSPSSSSRLSRNSASHGNGTSPHNPVQRAVAQGVTMHDGKSPRRLHAGIYGMILVPIEYMVLDETLDMEARRHKALITINAIEEEKNVAARWRKFYETGEAVLAAFSGAEVESHEGAVRVPAGSSWAVNADRVRVLTTPDPDVEGGTFLVCLVLMGKTKDVYIATHVDSNPTTDIALDMIPGVEAFARSLPESPKVRGAMVVLQDPIGDFKSLYWDGKRWINIVFI